MQEITVRDAELVGGAGAVFNFFAGKLASWTWDQIVAGNVDYSSIADQQDHYYNVVGA